MNPEMQERQSSEELANIYLAIENDSSTDPEKLTERKDEILRQLSARMPGETEIEREGLAADYIEQLKQRQSSDLEQAA